MHEGLLQRGFEELWQDGAQMRGALVVLRQRDEAQREEGRREREWEQQE
jgi:hypothetical protein